MQAEPVADDGVSWCCQWLNGCPAPFGGACGCGASDSPVSLDVPTPGGVCAGCGGGSVAKLIEEAASAQAA